MSNIIIGVTGGIAAYKICNLVRLLKQSSHQVRVIMTDCSKKFVSDLTLAALSGHKVYGDQISNEQSTMLHIELAKWAELVVVAPATATTLCALANGDASTLLTATCLATKAQCYLAPSMNQAMWHHQATQDNITKLKNYGYHILPPESGMQACGDNGFGRMAEPETIINTILVKSETITGLNILLTAGPTYEKLDPIRYIGNSSSGMMGYAMAHHLASMGANVHLISGPTHLNKPNNFQFTQVTSAEEMLQATKSAIATKDIFICAAAIANYSTNPSCAKIKSTNNELTLTLTRTPDILQYIAKNNQRVFCVGFCAETKNILDAAKAKLKKKGCHAIVANHIFPDGSPFGKEDNQALYVNNNAVFPFEKMSKQDLARQLIQHITSDFLDFRKQ